MSKELVHECANEMMKADWRDERETPPDAKIENYYAMARAAFSAIEREGFKVVPVEPTLQMRKLCTFEQVEIDWPELLKASSPTR